MTASPLLAWTLGGPELIIIAVLVLILFGAKKLPMFARSLGKSIGEFKTAKKEFQDEMDRTITEESSSREQPPAAPSGQREKTAEKENV